MREGVNRDPFGKNGARNEKNKALDIDFKSYTHMKAGKMKYCITSYCRITENYSICIF